MLFPKDKIVNYKNVHKKERCFIVATGPSINHTPLNLIKNEIIFGVNSLYKHQFSEHCNYYCLTDNYVWNNHKKGITELVTKLEIPLFATTGINGDLKNLVRLTLSDHKNFSELNQKDFDDFDKATYRTGTVVGTCLMLAYYMGFHEVNLVGCDCHYNPNGKHHFDGTRVDNYYRTNWKPVYDSYQVIKNIYQKTGRKIFNAGVGGRLEVFERRGLLKFANIAQGWKPFSIDRSVSPPS